MKKFFLVCFSIIMLSACSLSNTPKGKVEAYMNRYTSVTEDVKTDMETQIASENLSTSNKEIYKNVLTRQYEDIKYEVKDETIDGDKANVIVKITVYDLYKSESASLKYLNEHNDEFYENNTFNEESYTTYKLNEMLKASDTVDYEITFYLNKNDGEWIIQNPDRVTLEKIHGLYNYES